MKTNMMPLLRFTMHAAALVVAAQLSSPIGAQQIKVDKENRTIAVTTTATASAPADTAKVHIGFQTYGPDAATAYSDAAQTSEEIMKALTNAGIKKSSIQSDNQGLAEVPPYTLAQLPAAVQAAHKFLVTQSWTVTTKAADAEKILNLAIHSGANQSGQVEWTLAGDALQAEAAGKALKNAREIASQMAQGLGAKLGQLIYASNQQPDQGGYELHRGSGGVMGSAGELHAPTKILKLSPEEVKVTATVYAVFAIE